MVGIQNNNSYYGKQFDVSYKIKHPLTRWFSNHTQINTQVFIEALFIIPKLEATKMSFLSKQIDK